MKDTRTNEELHRALWRWLAETGEEFKSRWPLWESNGGNIEWTANQCFACKSAREASADDDDPSELELCNRCPIYWTGFSEGAYHCESVTESPFSIWNGEEDPEKRKRLAAIIAELPWKEGGWE